MNPERSSKREHGSGGVRAIASARLPSGVTWERIAEIFSAALDYSPADRDTFLTSACGDNAALMTEVRSLLQSLGLAGDFLEPGTTVGPPISPSLLAALEKAPLFGQFTPDALIAQRYRVKRLLGRGGAGEVYEAWDEELGIPVALKTLRFGAALGGDAVRSLKQEAMLARAVVQPNVCRVYDLGCHGDPQHGVWFITMEVLRGETLAARLRVRGCLTTGEALPLVEQMVAGLEAAHQAGVIHLDFKSGNVMLAGEAGNEQAVITDFGLARTMRQMDEDPDPDQPDTDIVGTPAYMAPEQVRGEPAGPAADIYALGVVLYEMVTGTLPFAGGTELEVARQRLEMPAPSARTVVPELDERWETVIRRCLEREPRRRFTRVSEVSEALAGRLAKSATSLRPTSPHSLPFERDSFMGRDSELAALAQAIADGARLVTLLGAGGMGKTRLAVHYGWRELAKWPGGIWFCDLTEARDENGIISAMGKAIGIRLNAEDPIAQLGQTLLAHGLCLVILDNSEQIVGQVAAILARWAEQIPQATFIITSRERLGLSQEALVDVGSLAMDAGRSLFIERAERLRPGIEFDAEDLRAVSEVVQLVEGMPLAIELAAARVRVMSLSQIASAMRKRFSLLTGGPSERHATLTAAIESSWELLQPWEKAAFAQCSVFEGGFTLEATEAVLDLTAFSVAPPAVDAIRSLVDKSLLRTWMASKADVERQPALRLGMFVSLQEYAHGKLAENGAIPGESGGAEAVRTAEERHGRWYGRYGTDDALLALSQHGGVERRRALSRERDNLLAATRRAAARGDGEVTTATYRAAAAATFAQGPYRTIVDLGRTILDAPLSPKQRALVLRTLAQAENDSGRPNEALDHYAAAMALFRKLGDRSGESLVLGNMGNAYLRQGRAEEACRCFEGALALDRERGSRTGEGILLHALGTASQQLGRFSEARTFTEAALAIHRANGARRSEALAMIGLGSLDCDQGRLAEGRAQLEVALGIYLELDDWDGEGLARRNLGICDRLQGALPEAAKHFERALTIYRDSGNRHWEGVILHELAVLRHAEGRMDEARDYADAALEIGRESGNRALQGVSLGALGKVLFALGQTAAAKQAALEGEALLRAAKTEPLLAELLCVRIELEAGSGNVPLAQTLLREVETIVERIGLTPDSEFRRLVNELRFKVSSL